MIQYKIYSPGGNTTALVIESLSVSAYAEVANKIMLDNSKVEQVGFVVPSTKKEFDFHLEMMGGEFCVNAARSAALLYSEQTGEKDISFTISGLDSIAKATVIGNSVSLFLSGTLFRDLKTIEEGWLVDLEGSRFIVTEDEENTANPKKIIMKYDDKQIPAIGLIHVTPLMNSGKYTINPWVYVRKTDTLINESACGSGSIVTCIAKFENIRLESQFLVIQPSRSSYEISFVMDGKSISSIAITGDVDYCGEGSLSE
ncbi:MAG: hypothetical protein WCG73_00550 [Candidatus Moraniibacteriota bacterium]